MENEIEEEVVCSECGSKQIVRDYKKAELVCADCGLVIKEDLIDLGSEWRAFNYEQWVNRSRVGAPLTYALHDKGLSTVIDWRNRDAYGKSISSKKTQFSRLRKWQRRIRVSNRDRNLAFGLSEIARMASLLNIPRDIKEKAALIYCKAADKNLIKGRSIEMVAASSLYIACKQSNVSRTLDEIAQVSRVTWREIGRGYRLITKKLGVNLMPTSPIDYLSRFCSKLNLSYEVQSKAVEILREADEKGLTSGSKPPGVAAAAIYISSVLCGERRSQRKIAEVAGVTEVTVRNRYKELVERLDIGIILD